MNQLAIVSASLLILTKAHSPPSWFVAAFNNASSGVTVSVGAELNRSDAGSVSIMTKHLPLGLFGRAFNVDGVGLIFHPGGLQELCSYPTNAFTVRRISCNSIPSDYKLTPKCSVWPSRISDYARMANSWKCVALKNSKFGYSGSWNMAAHSDMTPQEYGARFHGSRRDLTSTCHYDSKSTMLEAEEALLRECVAKNDTWCGNTPWNEVIVAPYTIDAVQAVFWSHRGPFRNPKIEDRNACHVLKYLDGGKLPIIEFAGFADGNYLSPESLRDWRSNMTNGGYKVEDHFRLLDASLFHKVCPDGFSKAMPLVSQNSPIGFDEEVDRYGVEPVGKPIVV